MHGLDAPKKWIRDAGIVARYVALHAGREVGSRRLRGLFEQNDEAVRHHGVLYLLSTLQLGKRRRVPNPKSGES